MVRKPVVLITGASGEIGHGLIERLSQDGRRPIITLDLKPLDPPQAPLVQQQYAGSILDHHLLERILSEFEVDLVFHLAALLSTRGEFTPEAAHQVNVEGTLTMLEFAQKQGESHGRPVVFIFPSSIAVYGMPTLEEKAATGRVREEDCNVPMTMYGCNKLYCEHLGRYYTRHYKQLGAETLSGTVDFRASASRASSPRRRCRRAARATSRPRCCTRPRRASPTSASSGRTRASRSWRCPTPSMRSSGWLPRPARADADRLQRRRLRAVGRRDPRASC